MPRFSMEVGGTPRMVWTSLDDFLSWVNEIVVPSAAQYGFKIVIEPIPKDEVRVDRA
ncbi:MAG: hypothetical protein IVW52_04790 [Acidimicrobiales bacterium]|nr:hypothetical protein [Acidimicrobiales bacterium]